MNRPHRCAPLRRPVEFKLPSFEEDKRLNFVDSVCATLMTSRFGDGAMYTLNPRFEGTADEPFDFLDLMKEDAIGWHEVAAFLGRTILGRGLSGGVLQRPARSKGIALTAGTLGGNLTHLESPANLGRGSPRRPGTFFSRLRLPSEKAGREEIRNLPRNRKGAKKMEMNPGTCD